MGNTNRNTRRNTGFFPPRRPMYGMRQTGGQDFHGNPEDRQWKFHRNEHIYAERTKAFQQAEKAAQERKEAQRRESQQAARRAASITIRVGLRREGKKMRIRPGETAKELLRRLPWLTHYILPSELEFANETLTADTRLMEDAGVLQDALLGVIYRYDTGAIADEREVLRKGGL